MKYEQLAEDVFTGIGESLRASLVRKPAPDPLEGFSNLTAAIIAGEPIDWARLDGLKTQCVNPELGALRGKLERVSLYYPFTATAWWKDDSDRAYIEAFNQAWRGKDGWALWVEGEIPLRRKTADQLKVGTYFRGEIREKKTAEMYVGETRGSKVVLYTPRMGKSEFPASEWVVIEEHGPFQKPEGK